MEKIVLSLLIGLFSITSLAAVNGGDTVNIHLRNHSSYYHDKSDTESLDTLSKKIFSKKPMGGFFEGAVWTKANVCIERDQKLHFVYKDPAGSIDVFVGTNPKPKSYDFLKIKGLAPHFWVDIPLELSKGCHVLTARYKSGDVLNFGATLMDEKSFRRTETNFLTFYSIYYALFSFILLIVFFFLLKFRTRLYFFFAALVITQDILGASLLNGFIFRFAMSPSNFVEYDIGNIFALLMNASLVAFAISFLKERIRLFTWLSWGFVAVQLVLVAPLLVNLFIPVHSQNAWLSNIVNNSILLSCFWALGLAVLDIGSMRARLFLFASGAKVGGQFVKTLLLQGDVSEQFFLFGYDLSFFVFNIGAIGSLIEAFAIVGILMASYFRDIEKKNTELKVAMEELKKSKMEKALVSLSKRLAHDIRGPLSALDMTISSSEFTGEHRAVAKQAVARLGDIAHNLLAKKTDEQLLHPQKKKQGVSKWQICDVVQTILSEKTVQYKNRKGLSLSVNFEDSVFSAFSMIERSEFQRALSNVMENAADSIDEDGSIVVTIERLSNTKQICIKTTDSGKGIPKSVLPNIGQEGFSFAKNGSGLGLFHAVNTIEAWGGELKIDSEENRGTSVSILLPECQPPAWFEGKLEFLENQQIALIEDDECTRSAWRRRIGEAFKRKGVAHGTISEFSNGDDFSRWIQSDGSKIGFFIFDHDLGSGKNGLELIKKFDLQSMAVLMTSSYEDAEIQRQCVKIGVKCIPKTQGAMVPIVIEPSKSPNEPRRAVDAAL